MYFAINFMIDDFEDICAVANASVNTSNYNVDVDAHVDVQDSFMKCNSYDCILSNYNQFNDFSDFNDFNDFSSRFGLLRKEEILETFVYNNYLNDCINVLVIFFVTSSSLLFSILIVSICVYQKMINQFVEKYNANKECYEYDTYFFEYLDEFNELATKELTDDCLNILGSKYIKQKTPKGDVLMTYNNSNSSFDYYCKRSNTIDFMYLDVVSRIYVVKYDCKVIYVDNYDNFELIKTYYANVSDISCSFDDVKENNIFYNKVNKKNKAKQCIEYVSNKYKYRGTFDDFNSYCKNNNYKIHTQDLLENDIFVLEKTIEPNLDAFVDHAFDDESIQVIEITSSSKDTSFNKDTSSSKDTSSISFKTFKTMVANSSENSEIMKL